MDLIVVVLPAALVMGGWIYEDRQTCRGKKKRNT